MASPPEVAAAILAGGGAARMGGRPKSFLEVGGRRIIDRQLEVLRPRYPEILISANEPERYAELGLPVVPDAVPGQGPLGGILAVLEAARADRVQVVACDMPRITAAALDLVSDPRRDADVVVPVAFGRAEPLFARYSRACAPAIRAPLAAGERKVAGLFPFVRVVEIPEAELRAVDPDLAFLGNLNAPGDLGS